MHNIWKRKKKCTGKRGMRAGGGGKLPSFFSILFLHGNVNNISSSNLGLQIMFILLSSRQLVR